jgi:hypothetical protein
MYRVWIRRIAHGKDDIGKIAGEKKKHTLNISNSMTALAPTGTSTPILLVASPNPSSQNSVTLPLQNNLNILGTFSNEQNITVHLPFSYK